MATRLPHHFMSSKANAGINHKTYGVTSEGVAVFLDIALRRCGLHPSETGRPFTVKLSGGPSGDVAGNALKVLHRMYLGDEGCKVVGMCDGTAVAEDPNGLSWSELLHLVNSGLPLAEYDTNALSPTGVLVLTDNNPEGVRRRNTFPLKVRADAFLPAGGRPGTINADNVGGFFHLADDGSDRKVPCCPLIVEGANLYITPEARDAMWRTAGVTVGEGQLSQQERRDNEQLRGSRQLASDGGGVCGSQGVYRAWRARASQGAGGTGS